MKRTTDACSTKGEKNPYGARAMQHDADVTTELRSRLIDDLTASMAPFVVRSSQTGKMELSLARKSMARVIDTESQSAGKSLGNLVVDKIDNISATISKYLPTEGLSAKLLKNEEEIKWT